MKEANATLLETGGATPNKIWQEGDSQNAIYAVRSLGIDPERPGTFPEKERGSHLYMGRQRPGILRSGSAGLSGKYQYDVHVEGFVGQSVIRL